MYLTVLAILAEKITIANLYYILLEKKSKFFNLTTLASPHICKLKFTTDTAIAGGQGNPLYCAKTCTSLCQSFHKVVSTPSPNYEIISSEKMSNLL